MAQVVLGIVVSQNVMLAIVSQAYDNVRGQGESLTSRVPLWTNTYRRIRWAVSRRRQGLDPRIQWCGRRKVGYEELIHNEWEKRWYALSCVPGIEVLSYYFTDFSLEGHIDYPNSHLKISEDYQKSSKAGDSYGKKLRVFLGNMEKKKESLMSYEDLKTLVQDLRNSFTDESLDMFKVKKCFCCLEYGSWGPREFRTWQTVKEQKDMLDSSTNMGADVPNQDGGNISQKEKKESDQETIDMCDAIMYSFGQKKKDRNVPLNKGSATQPTTQQDEIDGEENTIKERRSIITMLEEMKKEMRKLSEDVAKTQQAVAEIREELL